MLFINYSYVSVILKKYLYSVLQELKVLMYFKYCSAMLDIYF